jgi:DNA-binding NtrC family response regulator
LLDDFLARAKGAPALSREACRAVLRHRWRRHIKALSRVIEAAAVLAAEPGASGEAGGVVDLAHLPVEIVGADALAALAPASATARPPSMQAALQPPDDERTSPAGEKVSAGKPPPGFTVGDDAEAFDALEATDPSIRHHGGGRAEVPVFKSSVERTPPPVSADRSGPVRPPSAYHDLDGLERSYASAVDPDLIVEALKKARGNVSAAARYLGRPRALVLRWMREFQINPARYRE